MLKSNQVSVSEDDGESAESSARSVVRYAVLSFLCESIIVRLVNY